ncbi:hypothetical protein EVAR_25418_1 [Eumeta japonica]|uniref:Transmembrane protein n=1 Tax=Eumeta variegata TaxID=151549 RepID=A0A4C1V6F2_EUMVA|nr:hypothetical protein EVAR_25418_1 [Eumeta japonica]
MIQKSRLTPRVGAAQLHVACILAAILRPIWLRHENEPDTPVKRYTTTKYRHLWAAVTTNSVTVLLLVFVSMRPSAKTRKCREDFHETAEAGGGATETLPYSERRGPRAKSETRASLQLSRADRSGSYRRRRRPKKTNGPPPALDATSILARPIGYGEDCLFTETRPRNETEASCCTWQTVFVDRLQTVFVPIWTLRIEREKGEKDIAREGEVGRKRNCAVPQDCNARLQNAFGGKAPHLSTERRWYTEFDGSHVSLHDEIREEESQLAFLCRRSISIKKKTKQDGVSVDEHRSGLFGFRRPSSDVS